MTHFEAVVFDCDGVLVDSELLSTKTTQSMLAESGWHADLDELMHTFAGSSREFFIAEIERRIGQPIEPEWETAFHERMEQALRDDLTAIDGIHDALERIALPIAVASNSGEARIRLSLDVVGLLPRFESCISSADDVMAGKPEPDVYLHAAEVLGVAPERCIAIDDSRFGVEAAHRAGMFVIHYAPHGAAGATTTQERMLSLTDMRALPDVVDRLVRTGTAG